MNVVALLRGALTTLAFALIVAPVTAQTPYTELLCEVIVNKIPSGNALVLRDEKGIYYAGAADLNDWRVLIAGRHTIRYHDRTFYALDGATGAFDAGTSTLALTFPAGAFGLNTVDFRHIDAAQKADPQPATGGYVNYDLQTNDGTNGLGVTGAFNAAYSRNGNVWSTGGVAVNRGSGFTRLDTVWERDDLPALTRLRIGDSVVGGTILPASPRFAGLQWGTDFALDPAFVTVASPVFAGALPSDGTVDVIIDGRQVYQQQLTAGNFLLQNLPLTQGSGDVTLIVRDSSGTVQRVIAPYYATPLLLRAGLSQFEFDGGLTRHDYGTVGDAYSGAFASAQGRRGFGNQFTAGAAVSAASDGETAALEADWLLRAIGQFSAAVSERAGAHSGTSDTLTYSYATRRLSLGGRVALQSANFGTPDCTTCVTDTYQLQLNAGLTLGRGASASLTFARALSPGTAELRTAVASYTRSIGRNTLTLNLTRSQTDPVTAVSVSYALALGQRLNVSANVLSDGAQSSSGIDVASSLPASLTGTGYTFSEHQDTSGTAIAASVTQNLPDVAVSLRTFKGSTLTQYGAEAQGSVVFADGLVAFAQTIGQGFGIAEVPGYPNVRVYANDSEVGRTDRNGKVVLFSLQPLVQNVVTLDGDDIPLAANFQSTAVKVSPLLHSPAIARFAPEHIGGVLVALVDATGEYVPPGSEISKAGIGKTWSVAFEGAAYLDGVVPGRSAFRVRMGSERSCRFELDIPKNLESMPNVGVIACR